MTIQTYAIPYGKKLIPIQIPDHVPVKWIESHPMEPVLITERTIEDDIIAISREEGFAPGEQKALILAWILKQARIMMTDCLLPEETLKELYLESIPTLQEALDQELKKNPKARVVLIPDGLLSLPIL